jgi:hypothetical protein
MAEEWWARWSQPPESGACVHRPSGGICAHCRERSAKEDLAALLRSVRDEVNVEWTHHRYTKELLEKRDEEWERAVREYMLTSSTREFGGMILRRMGRKP